MQLLNKNKIAWLGALTLLFSYAEMLLPKILPFFRFGFGNIAILLALDLNPFSFLTLVLLKSVTSSFIAGTLISPFFLISLGQSITSGFGMYLFYKIKGRWLSIYGISMIGGTLSCITQIYLASFYIGHGTFALFGPMLIFSILASLITAFFSQYFKFPENPPVLINTIINKTDSSPASKSSVHKSLILVLSVLISSAFIFMNSNIYFLTLCLILCFTAEITAGRKIMILPHLFMWLFVIISSLFIPQGKILYSIGKIAITQDALLNSILKALKLSCTMALSQCCTNISLNKNGIVSLTLSNFNGLVNILKNTDGNFIKKMTAALQAVELKDDYKENRKPNIGVPVFICILTSGFFIYSRIV